MVPRRRRYAPVFGLLALVVCALPGTGGSAVAEESASFPTFDAIVLATPHDATAQASEVRAIRVPSAAAGQSSTLLGVVTHPEGAVVRGDTRDGVAWIVTDEDPHLPDWGAALFEVRQGQGARRVLGRVGHAGRPLASASGWVFVERGRAGALPTADLIQQGMLRVDPIAIDGYDPKTNLTRTLYTSDAYALHIAGEHAGAIIVYRVAPEGAALLAIDEASGASRVIAPLLPFARDFSIDVQHAAIVFSNRDAADPHVWTIERVDLASGLRTRMHAVKGEQPAALALPSGAVAFTADGKRGLVVDGHAMAPLGAGFDAPTLATSDGALLGVEHRERGGFDRSLVVDVASGRAVRVGGDERVTILALGSAAPPRAGGVR